MTVKHVLFVLTNAAEIGPNKRATGYFYPEVAHPFEVLDAAGIAVEYASPQGGKIVAAVCHGPVALLGVTLDDGTPLVQGRRLTAFSNAEEEGYAKADVPFLLEDALRAAGAEFSSTDPWQSKLVVDGRLITGQNPASGTAVGEAIVAALQGAK